MRFLGGRSRTSSPTIVVVVVVDIVYEEQAGAHGDGQKHGCSMALGGHEIKQFPISKMFFKRFFFDFGCTVSNSQTKSCVRAQYFGICYSGMLPNFKAQHAEESKVRRRTRRRFKNSSTVFLCLFCSCCCFCFARPIKEIRW